jgi:REP-associated tyrosine transposase
VNHATPISRDLSTGLRKRLLFGGGSTALGGAGKRSCRIYRGQHSWPFLFLKVSMMPIDMVVCADSISGMNNRDYKSSVPGGYFHIYNRGNAKQEIFFDDTDYRFFLLRLMQNVYPDRHSLPRRARPLPLGSFSVVLYCLMPNHFHLVLKQNGTVSTGTLMTRICTSYSKYFNVKHQRVGHLFQDQFKQKHITDNRYLKNLSAYIHNNPCEAGLVRNAIAYQWSSCREYAEGGQNGWCEKDIVLEQFSNPGDYVNFVETYKGAIDEVSMMPIDTYANGWG